MSDQINLKLPIQDNEQNEVKFIEDAVKKKNKDGISGCLSLSLTLQEFWKAHLSIRHRILAAAQGAWWVSPSPGASTPH